MAAQWSRFRFDHCHNGLTAKNVSVETGRTLWSWETRVSNYSPILATGGGLLFNSGMDRFLWALDADSGQVLWQTRLASQAMGYTVTFAVGGRQYIAVAAGGGFNVGALRMTPEADGPSGSNAVYVFALPQ
jgi:alcohol dehydrogenase (cytochrome c)